MREIAYVWNYRGWGGAQVYYFAMATRAVKKFKVTFVMPEGSSSEVIEKARRLGRVLFVPDQFDIKHVEGIGERLRRRMLKRRADKAMARFLEKNLDPLITVLHADIGFSGSFSLVARIARTFKVVYTLHTPLPDVSLRWYVWKHKGSFLGSKENVQFLASNGLAARCLSELTGQNVEVAYSGFDLDEIEDVIALGRSAAEVRSGAGVSATSTLIVLVGQLIERKGWRVLIEALPAIFEKVPSAEILWITNNPPQPHVAEAVDAASAKYNFRVLKGDELGGRQSVLELLRAADIFLIPSFEEGLPMALVEAMILGTACIGTPIGAIPEAIEDGVSGLIAETGSAWSLAEKVAVLADDPELRSRIEKCAEEIARTRFDNDLAAETTLKAYERAFGITDK